MKSKTDLKFTRFNVAIVYTIHALEVVPWKEVTFSVLFVRCSVVNFSDWNFKYKYEISIVNSKCQDKGLKVFSIQPMKLSMEYVLERDVWCLHIVSRGIKFFFL